MARYRTVIISLLFLLVVACILLWRFLIGPCYMLTAIQHGNVQKVALLTHIGINPNSDAFFIGGFMHCAAARGQVQVMAKLQELGANVNRLDEYGATPAHVAVISGQVSSLRWLLAHGADPSIKNRNGYTVAEYITNQLGMAESLRGELLSVAKAASNHNKMTGGHARNLSDIHFSADLTQEQVVTIWGQPDGYRGFGIAYFEYTLNSGQEVWITYLPDSSHRLNWALLFPVGGGKPKTLFAR